MIHCKTISSLVLLACVGIGALPPAAWSAAETKPEAGQTAPQQGSSEPPPPPAVPQPRVVPIDILPPTGPAAQNGPAVRNVPAIRNVPGAQNVPIDIDRPARRSFNPQSVADVPAAEVLTVAQNKTRPLDLPGATRDVVIGNPAIADVLVRAPRQVFLIGRATGDTNVFFLDGEGKLLRRVELHVGPDAEGAQAAITRLLPDDDIQVSTVGDALFLSGKVRTQQSVNTAKTIARRFVTADANVVNQLMLLGAQQVLLRVRVAEMNRTVVKQLGMRTFFTQGGKQVGFITNGGNAQGVGSGGIAPANSNYSFPVTGGQPPTAQNPSGTMPTQSQPLFGALPGTGNVFGGSGEYSTLASNNPGSWLSVTPWNLLVNFSALEQEGLVKTLAEPNLTTVSGEAARLLAGGEIPIPTASTNGVVTVEWKPFGVGLVFSPVILSNGNISLKLETEVSAIDSSITVSTGSGISVPGFKTRRASSVVELPSGGSLMIAGLLEENIANNINAVPGIRDVPVLGALFGSSAFQRDETELVITVNAVLVNPVEHQSLTLPTDGFIPASDLKRYFLLHLQENYLGKKIDMPPTALKGPVGYIVE